MGIRQCARSGGDIPLSVSKRFPPRKKQAENNLFRPLAYFWFDLRGVTGTFEGPFWRGIQCKSELHGSGVG